MQDILDDVFRMIELQSCLYFQRDFHAPWAMTVEGPDMAQFHIIIEGRACVETAEGVEVLGPGDIVLFPRGKAHILADAPGREPVAGRAVMASFATPTPLFAEGALTTRLICGHYEYRRMPAHPLFDGLPDRLIVRTGNNGVENFDRTVLSMLVAESAGTDPGGTSVVERLAEVLLVQVLRRYFALNPAPGDFLAGVMDKRLSRAIAKIHADFDEPLTLTGLAEQAGMSRSGFAEHFRTVTGLAPLQYVTRWRMLSAEKFLHDPDLSVPDVAVRTGYDSDISFARAFKRIFGVTPAKYRQQQDQASAVN